MKRRHRSVLLSIAVLALAVSGVLVAQDAVPSLQDLVGARGAAIDEIGKRGYTFIRTEKSDDSAYSYWRENENGQCVIARVSDGRVASIVSAPSSDCGTAAGGSTVNEEFGTVCGVILKDGPKRYRCRVTERTNPEGMRITQLDFPDISMKLHWHDGNRVGVEIEGSKTVQTKFATGEGETNFLMDGKTYFYISDRNMAESELRNFKD